MESLQSAIQQLKALLVDFDKKLQKPEKTFMILLTDYLQLKRDADRIFELKEEEIQNPQEHPAIQKVSGEVTVLLNDFTQTLNKQ